MKPSFRTVLLAILLIALVPYIGACSVAADGSSFTPSPDDCTWEPIDPDEFREVLRAHGVPETEPPLEVGTGFVEPRANVPIGSLTIDSKIVDPINTFVMKWLACVNKGALFGDAGYSESGLVNSYFGTSIEKWDDMVERVTAADYTAPSLTLLGLFGWTNLEDGRFGVYKYAGTGAGARFPSVEFLVLSGDVDALRIDEIISFGEVLQAKDMETP